MVIHTATHTSWSTRIKPPGGFKNDPNGGGPMMSCGCDPGCDCGCNPGGGNPSGPIYSWYIELGGSTGCNPATSVFKDYDGNNSASDTWITLQSSNTASVSVWAGVTGCCSCGCYQLGVQVTTLDGSDASDYFGTTTYKACDATFTWTKPNNVTNKDAVRDFTFTYYAFLDTGYGYTPSSNDIYIGELYVHIAYAEISIQFAGMGDFETKTSQGGQTVNNTVVVGQKVHAKVEYDPALTVTDYAWSVPTDVYVKDYETESTHGKIINHKPADYLASEFEFYYYTAATPFRE